MDSGNSNSMQSSSGDEEYDSRAESISSFLNNNNNPSSYPPPPAPAPSQQHQLHHHPSLFDLLPSNYSFDPLSSSNPNSHLNLDMVWSKRLRSDQPNCTDLGGLFIPSTSMSFSSSSALPHIPRGGGGGGGVITTETVSKSSSFSGPNNNNTLMTRNPKKRSRASRRAPTTVLTTDTTNFRAMVQEFTGIPAPPFTSSSPFSRTRLDLFGTSSRSTPSAFSPSSSYNNLLRPFPQKLINPIPFTSSNSMIDSIASASTTAPAAAATYISNYQPLPSQNLLNINMQNNPILNLQSFLQLPPKYPLANSSILETKPPPTRQGSSLEELQLRHAAGTVAHLNTNLMSGLQSWPGTGAGPAAVGSNENREELGLFANGKLSNFSQVDNGQESVNVAAAAAATATRAEGMVESWICSSD